MDLKTNLNIQSNDVYECVTRHRVYSLYSSSDSTHAVRYLHRSTGHRRRRSSTMTLVMGAAVAAAETTD